MGVGDQLELELPEVYRHRLLMDRKLAAARKVVSERTVKACADELDQIWGPLGHPVSASTLANALRDHERNYFRSEWDSWFADQSEEFREVIAEVAGRGKPKKTPAEELAVLKELLRSELGTAGAKLIRKAEVL